MDSNYLLFLSFKQKKRNMEQYYDVFISYSRKDYIDENQNEIPGNVVSLIKNTLTAEGITYWFDEEGIYSGQNFIEKIVNNIESSKVFLYLSTANANSSKWTCKEISSANEFGKPIIPVRIDKSPYNKKVMFLISDLDYIAYYNNPEIGLKDMVLSIKAHLKTIEEETERKKAEEQRLRQEEERRKEEERLRKEQEEKRRQEEQHRIITDIEYTCTKLNTEEKKIDLDRGTLLVDAERVADPKRKEQLKSFITTSSPIRQKIDEEIKRLKEKITSLEAQIAQLNIDKESLTAELEQSQTDSGKEKDQRNKRLVDNLKRQLKETEFKLSEAEKDRRRLEKKVEALQKQLEGQTTAPNATDGLRWRVWPWLVGLLLTLTIYYWFLLLPVIDSCYSHYDITLHLIDDLSIFTSIAFAVEVLLVGSITLYAWLNSRNHHETSFKQAFYKGFHSQWGYYVLFILLMAFISFTFNRIAYGFSSINGNARKGIIDPLLEELFFRFSIFAIASIPLVYLGKKKWMKALKIISILFFGLIIIIMQTVYNKNNPLARGEIYALVYATVLYYGYKIGIKKWEGRKTKALLFAHALAFLSSYVVNLLTAGAVVLVVDIL